MAQRIANEDGEGWTCLRCGEVVRECRPWSGDVLEEKTGGGGVGKNVGFATAAGGADAEGEGELREVEPVPEEEESPVEVTASMVAEGAQMGLEGSRGLSESLALAESEEWARGGASEDSQSEEYD